MMAKAISGAFIYVLKAFFSLMQWFLKSFTKVLKLLYVALPATCVAFILLLVISIFVLIGNAGTILSGPEPQPASSEDFQPQQMIPQFDIPGDVIDESKLQEETGAILQRDNQVVISMFTDLVRWWRDNIYYYHGSVAYIFLLLLTVLMFIPVVTVLLGISVLASFGKVLFIAVAIDAGIYLSRAILGKNFISQALGRYFRLFPEAGRKHYEHNYNKLLRKRNAELEEELRQGRRYRGDDFYEESEDYYEDEYDESEEYYEDEYDEPEEYYEDEYDELEDNYDDEYDEEYEDEPVEDYDEDYDEDYEDDYDAPSPVKAATTSFDFFAGCNSKDSVDRKYKSLVKLYHPDNMDGDTAALQEINVQYAEAKKKFQ
jgi:hypothetical protein